MTLFQKWLWGVGGSVFASLVVATAVFIVPYEYNHHIKTDAAVISIAQLSTEFQEYRWYQELKYLEAEEDKRPLSDYEKGRLNWIRDKLREITRMKYNKG